MEQVLAFNRGDDFKAVPPDSCCVDEEGDDVRLLVMVQRRGTAGGHGIDSECGSGSSVLYRFEKGELEKGNGRARVRAGRRGGSYASRGIDG